MIDLIDETKLRIALELLEQQIDLRVRKNIDNMEIRFKEKIKKRIKTKDYKSYVDGKVSLQEFKF